MCEHANWATVCGPHAVFVAIGSREQFDAIDLPAIDHRQRESGRPVLTKSIEQAGVLVVLQHWVNDA